MSHPINDQIFERISEEYQIYKMTVDYDLENESSITRYVIRDENEDLVRHNDRSFFASQEEAEKTLCEIVQKRFEEECRWKPIEVGFRLVEELLIEPLRTTVSSITGSRTSTVAQQFCLRSMPVRITFRRASFVETMWIFVTGRASLKQMVSVNSQDFTVRLLSR